MKKIYFDENKQAYDEASKNKLEISPICEIDQVTWAGYAGTDKWDIIDGQFVDISQSQQYIDSQIVKKNAEIQLQLDNLDIKSATTRAIREAIINGSIPAHSTQVQKMQEIEAEAQILRNQLI